MKRRDQEFYFKLNRTNGEIYLQIWRRSDPKDQLVRVCGSATKLNKILVEYENLKLKTKELRDNLDQNLRIKE